MAIILSREWEDGDRQKYQIAAAVSFMAGKLSSDLLAKMQRLGVFWIAELQWLIFDPLERPLLFPSENPQSTIVNHQSLFFLPCPSTTHSMQILCFNVSERKIRSGFLLMALLALIVTAFILPTAPGSTAARVMAIVYMVVFSVASYLIGARRKWLVAYGILAACVWIIGLADTFIPHATPGLEMMLDTLLVLLQLMLVGLVFRFSMLDPHASRADRIVAGISGYLIIAFLWAGLYTLHERILPGGLVDSSKGAIRAEEGDLLYYSFITLTTTGYGEILPVSPSARLLASLESVVGTLYLAVFIAALLGRSSNEPANSDAAS